jgi:hypothetical protein
MSQASASLRNVTVPQENTAPPKRQYGGELGATEGDRAAGELGGVEVDIATRNTVALKNAAPENSALWKLTSPPENTAPMKAIVPPENLASLKLTSPPECQVVPVAAGQYQGNRAISEQSRSWMISD